jgi:hypothetical protein
MTTQTNEGNKAAVTAELSGTQQTNGAKGDYTKYFYHNIEDLWTAVRQLQNENHKLRNALKEAL